MRRGGPSIRPQRRQRTLDAVRRVLLREAREQPLLLIFEDLHWIDSETQALLDGLVETVGSARLLLLVSYRPEYQHAWGSKTSYSQLRLDALPAERARRVSGRAPRATTRARAAQAPARSRRGKPVLPGGDASGRWWRRGRSPGSAARIA